jgi:hypothetical protein
MIDFTEIPYDTDTWELFARDFLVERGFFVESPPDRGPDHGKDMLVVEQLRGKVGNYRMRWLVSCKHFATSKKAVNEDDEKNILERIASFKADGFIGFYSTIASSGLNSRLNALRYEQKIKDYSIFDHRLVENTLFTVGYSHLMIRYLPKSYQKVKPLHLVESKYVPLPCAVCGKDVLLELFNDEYVANIVYVYRDNPGGHGSRYEDIVCVCKKDCDREYESRLGGRMTSWTDVGDLVIPIEFLRYCFATMNRIRDGNDVYTDEAFQKEKAILIALAQKVLRQTTEGDRERFLELRSLPAM